jgi:hypothetical protein
MFFSMSKAVVVLAAAMLSWDGALPLPQEAGAPPAQEITQPQQAVPQDAPYLEIYSEGYSRFEIMGDEIVAHVTGGVDFSYMGYKCHADELVYHHASQQAEATGDVQFALGEVQLTTAKAVLDVAAGKALLGEPVYGKLSTQGMLLEAQAAALTFAPGQPPESMDDVVAELTGGVSVFTMTGSWLKTEALTLNGGEHTLQTKGAFAMALSDEQLQQTQAQAGGQWGSTHVSGSQALLRYDADGLLSQADLTDLIIMNDAGRLAADSAVVTRQGPAAEPAWGLKLTGAPVAGHFARDGQTLNLSCGTLQGQYAAGKQIRAQLIDDVELDTDGRRFNGGQINFTQEADGKWRVNIVKGLELGFQLSDSPLELGPLPLLGVE